MPRADGASRSGGEGATGPAKDGGGEGEPTVKGDGALADATPDVKLDATDGSSNPTFRYVFVTSTAVIGNFTGTNPDTVCAAHANDTDAGAAAALKGRTWRAWISYSNPQQHASARLGVQSTIPYRLLDATIVANNYTDLVSGDIGHAINISEKGTEIAASPVWTGTTKFGMSVTDCNSWTAVAMGIMGKVGSSGAASGEWSETGDQSCTATARLYCFEL